ncbi:MAG: hypothetical protein HY526_08245 [Betaproteobacteria bacterium]|nr:hypothetical protein [Betaproteobacteria bacterium]
MKRLESEFAFVEADETQGRAYVEDLMKKLEPGKDSRKYRAYEQRREHLDKIRGRAIYVYFGDDPSSETAYLCAAVMPDEPLVFEYDSVFHKRSAFSLLRRCARALGYTIGEFVAGEVHDIASWPGAASPVPLLS